MADRVTKCECCRRVLEEDPSLAPSKRTPCPDCGSSGRLVLAEGSAHVTVRPRVAYETDRSSKTKIKGRLGDDWFVKDQKWNFVAQHVDGIRKRYIKVIRDGDSGETIRYDDISLSEKSKATVRKKQ